VTSDIDLGFLCLVTDSLTFQVMSRSPTNQHYKAVVHRGVGVMRSSESWFFRFDRGNESVNSKNIELGKLSGDHLRSSSISVRSTESAISWMNSVVMPGTILFFSEGALQSAQGYSRFLGGSSQGQLEEILGQRLPSQAGARRRIVLRPVLGG
jgi:hypothetical protein